MTASSPNKGASMPVVGRRCRRTSRTLTREKKSNAAKQRWKPVSGMSKKRVSTIWPVQSSAEVMKIAGKRIWG